MPVGAVQRQQRLRVVSDCLDQDSCSVAVVANEPRFSDTSTLTECYR